MKQQQGKVSLGNVGVHYRDLFLLKAHLEQIPCHMESDIPHRRSSCRLHQMQIFFFFGQKRMGKSVLKMYTNFTNVEIFSSRWSGVRFSFSLSIQVWIWHRETSPRPAGLLSICIHIYCTHIMPVTKQYPIYKENTQFIIIITTTTYNNKNMVLSKSSFIPPAVLNTVAK